LVLLQPHLRVLAIVDNVSRPPPFIYHSSLRGEFCILMSMEERHGCHQVIESLPARYAREITHLYMDAIHGYNPSTDGAKSVISGALESYGENLSFLYKHW